MSAQDNDIYDWPLDWFGSHRAYRVDRAMKTVRRQLSGLMSDKPPGLLFEAAVLQDDPANGIPAHNFTLVRPYSSEKCDPILKSLRGKILDFLNTITTNKDLIDKTFDANWLSRAQKNFQDLGKGGSDPALLRRCFDDVVGVVTRLPVRGYTHQVLCEHYFSPDSIPRPLWYNTSVAEHADGELYGKITATPNNALKPAIQNKDQQPYPGCKLSQLDGLLMSSMLPLVTEHAERPSWRKLDLIAIPVHTIHRWNEPTFGTFLGWLYVNTKYQDGSTVPEVTSKVLQTLWPLLDSFAAELIEGETQDYYGHYHGEKEPLKEMTDAIPHLSGWRVTNGTFPVEPDAEEVAEFDDSTRKLFVRLGVLGSADAHITLEPRWTTSVPPKTDEVHLFGIRRFAHRLKRLYRGFSVLFAQSESARLRKYEQMLQLLQSPLAELSRSIGTMQSETQELRAVLYDPAQTIFASSFVLRELFDERSVIEVSPSIRFITAHEPLQYSNKTKRFAQDRKQAGELSTEAGMICAIEAVCRIFGIERQLRSAQDLQELRLLAKIALKKAKLPAFAELTNDVLWLAGKRDNDDIVEFPDFDWDKNLKVFLENLKAVAFTPFKVDADSWHPRAIELALRPWKVAPTYEGADDSGVVQFSGFAGRSPLPYSELLDFLIKLSSSKSSRKPVKCVVASETQQQATRYTVKVTFSSSFDANENAIERLRNLIAPVLAGLREWRLHGSALGNWQAPFVEMSNRLLGIVKHPATLSAIPGGCWCSAKKKALEKDMILSLENSLSQKFNIRMQDQDNQQGLLTIEWQ